MGYIAMDCVKTNFNGVEEVLITVVEYTSNDPIILTGSEIFYQQKDFIDYLKTADQLGFDTMYTEEDSLLNFSTEDLHELKSMINLKFY